MNYNYEKYKDIINLPHHVSKKHPQMLIYARAAQFAPFAALTGYEEEVKETARQTSKRKELDEELKKALDKFKSKCKSYFFCAGFKKGGWRIYKSCGKCKENR